MAPETQEALDPQHPRWGSQALRTHLCSVGTSRVSLVSIQSSLRSLPGPVTWTRRARRRGCPGRPPALLPACHPHGHRSVPTPVHTSLPGVGSWFSGDGQTKKSPGRAGGHKFHLARWPPDWMLRGAGAGSAVASGDVPSVGRGSPRPRGGRWGAPARGEERRTLRRGGGLTLLRCGSRVSR